MHCLWSVVAIVVVGCITPAWAQVQDVNRTASGQPGTDIRVGVYVNVRPDCTSGSLPSIQRYSVSGVLPPSCGGRRSSEDANGVDRIGSHIWSTIKLELRRVGDEWRFSVAS